MSATALLMDVGNSALKWAMADTQALSDAHRIDLSTVHDDALRALCAQHPGRAVLGCVVASEAVRARLEGAAASVGVSIRWLTAQDQFDAGPVRLINGYRLPQQLGADRWHAMLGARERYPNQAWVLVQVGTATTIDGVTAQGQFVGGEILPGPALMHASLAQGTARLPHTQAQAVAFADNTDEAIASGVLDAQWGAIERYWRRFAARDASSDGAGGAARLILTGGGATHLAQAFQDERVLPFEVQHNLVLRGLWLRWKQSLDL